MHHDAYLDRLYVHELHLLFVFQARSFLSPQRGLLRWYAHTVRSFSPFSGRDALSRNLAYIYGYDTCSVILIGL